MEEVVAKLLVRVRTLAVAESLTGGLIASRLVNVPRSLYLVSRGRGELRLAGQV